jgi:hypothetical protein
VFAAPLRAYPTGDVTAEWGASSVAQKGRDDKALSATRRLLLLVTSAERPLLFGGNRERWGRTKTKSRTGLPSRKSRRSEAAVEDPQRSGTKLLQNCYKNTSLHGQAWAQAVLFRRGYKGGAGSAPLAWGSDKPACRAAKRLR